MLKQLAPQLSYRSLVALGIASIQGSSVASFEREDAERLLFFCARPGKELPVQVDDTVSSGLPAWFKPATPTRKRPRSTQGVKFPTSGNRVDANGGVDFKLAEDGRGRALLGGGGSRMMPLLRVRHRPKVAAMRPIPYARRQKALPSSAPPMADTGDRTLAKSSLHAVPIAKHSLVPPAISHRRSLSSSFHAQQIISLNPLPLKKHGCGRAPIHACSEVSRTSRPLPFPPSSSLWSSIKLASDGLLLQEEFLMDVMQFLLLRGHSRLVPQGGISEFPDAILNAKRLDLYNLYREVRPTPLPPRLSPCFFHLLFWESQLMIRSPQVVSRGGFHVGNGINWKGQVFSKMRNHTMTNKMTVCSSSAHPMCYFSASSLQFYQLGKHNNHFLLGALDDLCH